jgi:hypothetical protein
VVIILIFFCILCFYLDLSGNLTKLQPAANFHDFQNHELSPSILRIDIHWHVERIPHSVCNHVSSLIILGQNRPMALSAISRVDGCRRDPCLGGSGDGAELGVPQPNLLYTLLML